MANREIDISVKIANLIDLQEQLKTLTANVKLGGDFQKLMSLSESPLVVNINLGKIDPKVQQLLDLAQKGLNISANGTVGSVAGIEKINGTINKFIENLQALSAQFARTSQAKDLFIGNLKQLQQEFTKTAGFQRTAAPQGTILGPNGQPILPNTYDRLRPFSRNPFGPPTPFHSDYPNNPYGPPQYPGDPSGEGGRFPNQPGGQGYYNSLYRINRNVGRNRDREAARQENEADRLLEQENREFLADARKQIDFVRRQRAAQRQLQRQQEQQELQSITGTDSFSLRRNRSQINVERGIRETENDVLSYLFNRKQFEENKLSTAARLGFDPSKLAGTNAKLFRPSRITENPETLTAVLFSGLFGGVPAGLGAAAGASIFSGPTGALAGTAILTAVARQFETIREALQKAADAGLKFEASITAITAVLQTTSRVTGYSGETLPIESQLRFQRQRATQIQLAARRQLLPLGISGEEEATVVQRVISAAAQRGIILDPNQAATIAARLGGAGQTLLGPQFLSSPQGARDIEDVIIGVQRGQLNLAIRGFSPGIGQAVSGDDLLKRTEKLQQIVNTNINSSSPDVVLKRLDAAFNQLETTFGDALLQGIVPGINEFAKALNDPSLQGGLETLGKALGQFGSDLIELARRTVQASNILALGDTQGRQSDRLGTAVGVFGGAFGLNQKQAAFAGDVISNFGPALAEEGQRQEKLSLISKLPLPPIAKLALGALFGGSPYTQNPPTKLLPDVQVSSTLSAYGINAQEELQKTLTESLNNPITSLFGDAAALRVAQGQKGLSESERRTNLNQQLGLSLRLQKDFAGSRSEFESFFDQSTIGGKIGAAASSKQFISGQLGAAEQSLRTLEAQKELQRIENEKNLAAAKTDEAKQNAQKTADAEGAKLDGQILTQQKEIVKLKNEEVRVNRELIDLERQRNDLILKTFDTFTFVGQRAQLLAKNANDLQEIRRLEDLQASGKTLTDEQRSRLGELKNVELEANQRAFFNQQLQLPTSELQFRDSIKDFADAQAEAKEKTQSFSDELIKATNALNDFRDQTRLRALGRQGETLAEADRLAALGGNPDLAGILPSGDLVKGTPGFNPESRRQFERDLEEQRALALARQNNPFRVVDEESAQENQLQFRVSGLGRQQGQLERSERERIIEQFRQTAELKQRLEGQDTPFAKYVNKQYDELLPQAQRAFKEAGVEAPDFKALPKDFVGPLGEIKGASLPETVRQILDGVNKIVSLLGGGGKGGPLGTGSGGGESSSGGSGGGSVDPRDGGYVLLPPTGPIEEDKPTLGPSKPSDRLKKFQQRVKNQLSKLSPDVLKALKLSGASVEEPEINTPALDIYGDPSHGGYAKGDSSVAEYDPLANKISYPLDYKTKGMRHTNFDNSDSELKNVLSHEIGHAFDKKYGLSSSKEFLKAYQADLAKISPQDKKDLDYYLNPKSGTDEAFAGLFEDAYGDVDKNRRNDLLQKDLPTAFKVLKKLSDPILRPGIRAESAPFKLEDTLPQLNYLEGFTVGAKEDSKLKEAQAQLGASILAGVSGTEGDTDFSKIKTNTKGIGAAQDLIKSITDSDAKKLNATKDIFSRQGLGGTQTPTITKQDIQEANEVGFSRALNQHFN